MKSTKETQVISPAAMGRKQAAFYLGCSVQSIDKLVREGKLKRCLFLDKPSFRRVDLDNVLEASLEVANS